MASSIETATGGITLSVRYRRSQYRVAVRVQWELQGCLAGDSVQVGTEKPLVVHDCLTAPAYKYSTSTSIIPYLVQAFTHSELWRAWRATVHEYILYLSTCRLALRSRIFAYPQSTLNANLG